MAPSNNAPRIGRYQVLEVIGEGTFGVSLLAQDRTGARVAIKVLKARHQDNPATRGRFTRELRAGQLLRSHYFARVLEWDLESRQPWIAFSYVEGVDLREVLNKGPLPPYRVYRIALQLAEALQDLSQAGLIHRDLKPDNIRLGPNDAVTVVDLGIAGAPDWTTLTLHTSAIGTPAYMAPEQYDGKDATGAMDVWAFGVILAELSGGRYPFPVTEGQARLEQAIRGARADLSAVPAPWDGLVRRCLARKPARRPTAADLHKSLRGTAGGSESVRRSRSAWWVAGTAACVALGAVAFTLYPAPDEGRGTERSDAAAAPTEESSPPAVLPSRQPTSAPIEIALAPANGDALLGEVVRSSPAIRAMAAGQWVPQVSSKCAGLQTVDLLRADGSLGADGTEESYPEGITEEHILQFHDALNERFNDSVIMLEGTATPACAKPRMWVSLATLAKPTQQEITDWCTGFGFPQGECLPRQLTDDDIEAAAYRPFLLGDDAHKYRIDLPVGLNGVHSASGAKFTDTAGASLTVNEYEGADDPDQPTRDQARQIMSQGAEGPTYDVAPDSGFVLSGVASDGLIYYWRRYPTPGITVDLIWRYPTSAAGVYDKAVTKGVRFGPL